MTGETQLNGSPVSFGNVLQAGGKCSKDNNPPGKRSTEEETTTNLIKLETGDREGKPYLTLDLTEKNLILKCSNFSLKSQIKDPSSFYVEISQFYARTRGKVSAKSIKIVK